jgi:hypothetical protein
MKYWLPLLCALVLQPPLPAQEAPEAPGPVESKLAEPLSYYLKQHPTRPSAEKPRELEWESMPPGKHPQFQRLGDFAGRTVIAVRYLVAERLEEGRVSAAGVLILADAPEDYPKFTPVYFLEEEPDVIEDYAATTVRKIGGREMFWLRVEAAGNSGDQNHFAISLDPKTGKFAGWDLLEAKPGEEEGENDPLKAFKAKGWEIWHRGNYFDEETLTQYYNLYKPESDKGEEQQVKVPYTFKNGKLRPGKAVVVKE